MVGRDITERRRRAIRMVTALLAEKEALLDNALVGIIMVRQRQIVSCNRRFGAIFGYPSATLVGQSTRILFERGRRLRRLWERSVSQSQRR
jgi:PAS domain S-box-containing protein